MGARQLKRNYTKWQLHPKHLEPRTAKEAPPRGQRGGCARPASIPSRRGGFVGPSPGHEQTQHDTQNTQQMQTTTGK